MINITAFFKYFGKKYDYLGCQQIKLFLSICSLNMFVINFSNRNWTLAADSGGSTSWSFWWVLFIIKKLIGFSLKYFWNVSGLHSKYKEFERKTSMRSNHSVLEIYHNIIQEFAWWWWYFHFWKFIKKEKQNKKTVK